MEERRTTSYAIALAVTRHSDGTFVTSGLRPVKVILYNVDADYAIIEDESVGTEPLVPILIFRGLVEPDTDLKVFHCPVGIFLEDESLGDLSVFTKWVKTSRPSTHHVTCDGGLCSGSSGAPFVSREGYVVGMHVERISQARPISSADTWGLSSSDTIEVVSDSVFSIGSNHASYCRALLLHNCKKLMDLLAERGII
jgi:hypothetical protein